MKIRHKREEYLIDYPKGNNSKGIFLVQKQYLIGFHIYPSSRIYKVDNKSKNRVAVINYNPQVTEAFTTKIMEKLDEIRKDKSYKSVLFIMNSPGGSPTASEEFAVNI